LTDGGTGIPEVHALLRVLAAGRDVLELGSAFGVGAATMAETARHVTTVELDPERAAATRKRVRDLPNVAALAGVWRLVDGEFGLVFADHGDYDWERILELASVGGYIVKDDLTPGRAIAGDPVREFLLRDARLAACEILTTATTTAIVAVRLR
jgi:predicted O-methyltransferase YrrM